MPCRLCHVHVRCPNSAVEGGHRGIVFNRITGLRPEIYNEGINFNLPWLEHPIIFDVRTRPRVISSLTGSRGEPQCNTWRGNAGRHTPPAPPHRPADGSDSAASADRASGVSAACHLPAPGCGYVFCGAAG